MLYNFMSLKSLFDKAKSLTVRFSFTAKLCITYLLICYTTVSALLRIRLFLYFAPLDARSILPCLLGNCDRCGYPASRTVTKKFN